MVDQDGLLVEGMNAIASFQQPFAAGPREAVAAWPLEQPGRVTLLDVVRNAQADDADRRVRPAGLVHRARSSAPWPTAIAGR